MNFVLFILIVHFKYSNGHTNCGECFGAVLHQVIHQRNRLHIPCTQVINSIVRRSPIIAHCQSVKW